MKINNNFLVIDLEATSNQETDDHIPDIQENNFIIQIGAVLLNKELDIISTYNSLVKPEEPVTPFITSLTGITQEQVEKENTWDIVAKNFNDWILQYVPIKSIRLCAHGNYFDINLLRKCYSTYGIRYPFSGTCYDVKTLAMLWCSLSNRRTDKLSVQRIAEYMNINPEGKYHDALIDAMTSARILKRVFEDFDTGFFMDTKNNGQAYTHMKISKGDE